MRFGSVCSGIEAASVAWGPLGWEAAWLSEIEPFPCAVLAHHYPEVPNLGDMTALPERIAAGEVEAPDIFCGGTPCQAFSVAGLRKSLDDARGNLSLVFCEIANAIDTARSVCGHPPAVIFWENVPGVLSTKDNAFGCFLAGLAGEDDPLEPPGGKWTNAGCVSGPQRTVAWRVLDAQYFGVAQRRRRVFVVASARNGFDPTQVLFEWDGVRRDSAPSREARQTAPTIPARSTAGGGLGTDFDIDGGLIQAYGIRTANTSSNGWGIQEEATHTLDRAMGVAVAQVCPTLRAGGNRTGGDRPPGTDVDTADSLIPVVYSIQAGALRTNPDSGPDGVGIQADHAYTLEARAEVQCVAFDATQITSAAKYSNPQPGDPCHPLAAGAHAPAIAFHPTQDPISSTDGTTHCMGAGSSQGNATIAVAVQASQSGVRLNDTVGTLDANYGSRRHNGVMQAMQVRRLTPTEAERLQGFPDGYTAIPWRGKPADQCPDGPRYKALGNSWAVPNVRWIGERIKRHLAGEL